MICSPSGDLSIGDFCRDPSLMWAPWMSSHFHLKRSDIVAENVTLSEIVAMWDSAKS